MLKISTCFTNRIPSANLIFRDAENKGTNLIYMPEFPNRGTGFINLYRRKSYWDYVIIPKTFSFIGFKIHPNIYYKDFKKVLPMVRVQRKFTKNSQEMRSIVIDLTPLSEDFSALSKTRSKKMVMEAFITLIEGFALDNKTATARECYLLIDGNGTDNKEIINGLFYYSRLSSGKLRITDIEGILLYGNSRFWPLTTKDSDKDGSFLKININILTRYMKEVHLEDIDEKPETPEESIETTKNVVEKLYQVHIGRKTTSVQNMYTDKAKKSGEEVLEEDPLESIKSEVLQNQNIKGKDFEEKLTNLFKTKAPQDTKDAKDTKAVSETAKKAQQVKDNKQIEMIKTINKNLKELNKKHNGVIDIDPEAVERNASSFYKPLNIVGFTDFHAYGKQKSEFGEILDQAMMDLIKSIEIDKELGIKVQNVKTEITDTYDSRLKTYKIKLKHDGFGFQKPYTVSFHVPIPSQGKYLKVGGNDYIMINQFYSKPVVKVSPKMVRVYTHYSTCAISLKHHAINDIDGVEAMIAELAMTLKQGKKLKSAPKILNKEEIQELKKKYDLSEYMNNDIFVNLEIKE